MLSILKDQGNLYVDLTPEIIGLKKITPAMGIPIVYTEEAWKKLATVFMVHAQENCPVDTGYLRDNIGAAYDGGGAELWSDAPYSAYQEYGTAKMAAQPYFESAVTVGIAAVLPEMEDTQRFFLQFDADLVVMETQLVTKEDWMWAADRLNYYSAEFQRRGMIVEAVLEYKEHVQDRINEIEELEDTLQGYMGNPLLAMLIAVLTAELVNLLTSAIFFPIDLIKKETHSKTDHHRTRGE